MAFYTGLHGCTITPEGKAYITPLRQEDFEDSRLWTTSPISTFLDLPLKFTNKRTITDTGETGVSDRDEENLPATRLWLDVKADSTNFGHPPHDVPLHGNITFARVDGNALHPFVLKFTVGLIEDIVDYAMDKIAEARTRGEEVEQTAMGRCHFRSEVFHEGLEMVRQLEKAKGPSTDWDVVENPFRARELP